MSVVGERQADECCWREAGRRVLLERGRQMSVVGLHLEFSGSTICFPSLVPHTPNCGLRLCFHVKECCCKLFAHTINLHSHTINPHLYYTHLLDVEVAVIRIIDVTATGFIRVWGWLVVVIIIIIIIITASITVCSVDSRALAFRLVLSACEHF